MSLRSILRDGIGSISRRGSSDRRRKERGRSAAAASSSSSSSSASFPDLAPPSDEADHRRGSWAGLPPELLREVVKRLEQSEPAWPARRHLVACAAVCRSWQRVCKEIVGAPEVSGQLTFPVSLKQAGPRSGPIQCYITRNKATSTYKLLLGLDPENGKFLLAARKIRRPTHAEYIISMGTQDVSRNCVSYMGKLRSNFLGTKFAIYDSQPPYSGAVTSSGRSSRRFYSRKVSPKVPSGSYGIAHVAYELNMLGTRGPRRMCCTMHSIPATALEPTGSVPSYHDATHSLEDSLSGMSLSRPAVQATADSKSVDSSRFTGSTRFMGSSSRLTDSSRFTGSMRFTEVAIDVLGKEGPLILKNKPPRWHEQLQCWCLNFRGRVTIASVKNFQLIAASGEPADNNNNNSISAAGTSQVGPTDHDKIILQFGKIGKDLFTMDYRYPLSAFQAFGICLTSFDTKLACE